MENPIKDEDVMIPMSIEERKKWMDFYMSVDPVINSWLEPGINQDSLTSALFAKCLQHDRLREAMLAMAEQLSKKGTNVSDITK